jgi:hypothetical protein
VLRDRLAAAQAQRDLLSTTLEAVRSEHAASLDAALARCERLEDEKASRSHIGARAERADELAAELDAARDTLVTLQRALDSERSAAITMRSDLQTARDQVAASNSAATQLAVMRDDTASAWQRRYEDAVSERDRLRSVVAEQTLQLERTRHDMAEVLGQVTAREAEQVHDAATVVERSRQLLADNETLQARLRTTAAELAELRPLVHTLQVCVRALVLFGLNLTFH